MSEHITNERLAALLDDGVEDRSARDHLESCPACRRELDLLRRMRMALSAMNELEPPAGQWDRIARSLPGDAPAEDRGAETRRDAERGRDGGDRGPLVLGARVRDIGWLRAAAGVVLFAGGLGLGSLLGPLPGSGGDGSGDAPAELAGPRQERPTAATAAGPAGDRAELAGELRDGGAEDVLRQLEMLGSSDLDPREAYRNPTAAAERLARLDALVRAAREALQEDPADPAMNQFLFRVVEERQQLNQALHMASLDYR